MAPLPLLTMDLMGHQPVQLLEKLSHTVVTLDLHCWEMLMSGVLPLPTGAPYPLAQVGVTY